MISLMPLTDHPEDIVFFFCFVIFVVAQGFGLGADDWNPDCTADSPGPCERRETPWDSFTTRGWTFAVSIGVLFLLLLHLGSAAAKKRQKWMVFVLCFAWLCYLVGVWVAKISAAGAEEGPGAGAGNPQCNALLPQSKLFTDGPHMTYKIFLYLIMIYLLLQFWTNPDWRLFGAFLFVFPVIILVNEAVAWIIGLNIDEKGASGKSIDIVELYKNYILGPGKDGTYGDSAKDDRGVWWIAEGPKLLLRLALVGALIYGARKLTSPWSTAPWKAVLFVLIITGFPLILRFMVSDNCLFSRVATSENWMDHTSGTKWWHCTLDKYGGIQAWFIFVVLAYIISVLKS